MHAAETRPAQPVAISLDPTDPTDERRFSLRIPCSCSPVAHTGQWEECSLCQGERERLVSVPEATLKADHIELVLPRERVAALRALCVRGECEKARSECLRIALARSDEARRRAREDRDGGPLPLQTLVRAAVEMVAWRTLAHYCHELGGGL